MVVTREEEVERLGARRGKERRGKAAGHRRRWVITTWAGQ